MPPPKLVDIPGVGEVEFPGDMSDEEIATAAARLIPASEPAKPGKDWVDQLPAVMGTAASFLGGSKALPTGLAAAGLGGAAGEAARILIRAAQGRTQDVPGMQADSAFGAMGEAAKSIGKEALSQGTLEGLGRMAGGIVTPAAKAIYGKVALRPIQKVMDDVGYTKVRDMGFNEKMIPGLRASGPLAKVGIGGARENLRKLQSGVNATKRIEQAYDAAGGAPIDVATTVSGPIGKLAGKASAETKYAGLPNRTQDILDQAATVSSGTPKMGAREMGDALRTTDEISQAAHEAARIKHERVPPASEGAVAKGLGEGYRTGLRRALQGTDWAAQKAENQTRFGLQRALERSADRPEHLTTLMSGMAVTANPAAAVAMRTALLPTVSGGASVLAPGLARQAPRALDFFTQGAVADPIRDAILEAMQANTEIP